MNLKEKFKNRYNIMMGVIVLIILILSIRLAVMTIAEGDYYRDISDNKIVKDVYKPPIRGEIKDRNGKLLAGSKPSFTVQMLKDEVKELSTEEKNGEFLSLIRFLEEDGAPYIDDFPIELNVLSYENEEAYEGEFYNPMDKVVDIIAENNLLNEILNMYYVNKDYDEHFEFVVLDRAIHAFKNKGIDIPIVASIESGDLKVEFDDTKDIESFKEAHNLGQSAGPIASLLELIDNDKAIIRKLVDQSIARKLTYDLLKAKNLEENLVLEDFSNTFEEEYSEQKRTLIKQFPKVTKKSSAEDDFLNIFHTTSLKNFLNSSFEKDTKGKKEYLYPGEILFDMMDNKKMNVPVDLTITDDGGIVYEYEDGENNHKLEAIDYLVEEIVEKDIYREFMVDDVIRPLAQKQILEDGVNPRISVSEGYEYVSKINLNDFYEGNNISEDSTAEEAFYELKEKYELDEKLSVYETRPIFVMYQQLAKQGYLAYQPIYIAYGIKESTVAKIEESIANTSGINISIEPVRYYPEGKTAAHILGYLGKISQPDEIEKYINDKKYSPSSLIGKTGIEQSFEENLKGKGGIKKVEVDSSGNSRETIEEENSVPGDNLYLSIDADLQKSTEDMMERTLKALQTGGTYKSKWGDYKFNDIQRNATSGATVAIDVKTGKVLTSVSYPAYDPNLFSTGITSTDWESLFPEDEDNPLAPRPLYNIATQTAITPGSTIKMLTALTALEKGLSADKGIRDMGYVDIGNKQFNCLLWTTSRRTHGYENLYDALRDSCNYYFYTLAMGRNQKTGEHIGVQIDIEDIIDMSKKMGLDDKTGIEINIPAESSGGAPSPKRKTENTKAILGRVLNREIEKTFQEGYEYDEEVKESAIEEIISWLDMEEIPSYSEVIRRLGDLNIDPNKKINHSGGQEDTIADALRFTYLSFGKWNIGDTLYATIGQGDTSYTPIQMANYVAIIANGGYRHKLTLIDSIKNYDNTKSVYEYEENSERVELNNYSHLEDLKKGMLKVTKEGYTRTIFQNFPIDVGAKTGTAERDGINPYTNEEYDDFSWFVAFAPYDDPQIAVATVLFQGGSGGYSAPLTRDIIGEYLKPSIDEEEESEGKELRR